MVLSSETCSASASDESTSRGSEELQATKPELSDEGGGSKPVQPASEDAATLPAERRDASAVCCDPGKSSMDTVENTDSNSKGSPPDAEKGNDGGEKEPGSKFIFPGYRPIPGVELGPRFEFEKRVRKHPTGGARAATCLPAGVVIPNRSSDGLKKATPELCSDGDGTSPRSDRTTPVHLEEEQPQQADENEAGRPPATAANEEAQENKSPKENVGTSVGSSGVFFMPQWNNQGLNYGRNDSTIPQHPQTYCATPTRWPAQPYIQNGYIFMCNAWTETEVFQRRIFGLPNTVEYTTAMESITEEGSVLFLFNLKTRVLYGVFKPSGKATIDRHLGAFRNKFRLHLPFTIINRTFALAETNFPPFLKETTNRCMPLTASQVQQLISLMDPYGAMSYPCSYPIVCNPGIVAGVQQYQGYLTQQNVIMNPQAAIQYNLAYPMAGQMPSGIHLTGVHGNKTKWSPKSSDTYTKGKRTSTNAPDAASGAKESKSPPLISRRKFTNSKFTPCETMETWF